MLNDGQSRFKLLNVRGVNETIKKDVDAVNNNNSGSYEDPRR